MSETRYSLRDRSSTKRKPSTDQEPLRPKAKRQKQPWKKAMRAESLVEATDTSTVSVKDKKRSTSPSLTVNKDSHSIKLEPNQSAERPHKDKTLAHVEAADVKKSAPEADIKASQHGILESVERVFHTAELLEMILLRVPDADDSVISAVAMKTILLSQRVNKFFQATIEGSAKLERLLWLLPPLDHGTGNQFRLNPMLRANLHRGDTRPFAQASTAPRSGGSCAKIICTEQGLFGPGCESAKGMLLAKSARSQYACEVTFKPPPGVDVPPLPDFVLDLPRNATVGDLEDAVFQRMESYVLVSGKQSAKKNALAFKWTLPLHRAKRLRATTGR